MNGVYNRDSFDEIYRRNKKAVRSFLRSKLGWSDVPDAEQETWLRLWAKLGQEGNPVRNPQGWLISTARLVVRHLRSGKRGKTPDSLDDMRADRIPGRDGEPLGELVRKEEAEAVEEYAGRFVGDRAEAVRGVFLYGETPAQIQRRLGRSKVVNYWINRAEKDLAGVLNGEGGYGGRVAGK